MNETFFIGMQYIIMTCLAVFSVGVALIILFLVVGCFKEMFDK